MGIEKLINRNCIAGLLVLSIVTTAFAQPATQPATKPAKKMLELDIPALKSISANDEKKSSDDRVNTLLGAINTRVRSTTTLKFAGGCTWFNSNRPHPISVTYSMPDQTADIVCGTNQCKLVGTKLTYRQGEPMQVDVLYALIFRTFDPSQFTASTDETLMIGDQTVDCIRLDGKDETLWVSEQSGNPVRLKTSVTDGPVIVDYDTNPKWPAPILPSKVVIHVPVKWFGFPLDKTDEPVIQLDVHP